eukprot:scaffold9991_cov90-Skeletonema_marinoi.AAC.5
MSADALCGPTSMMNLSRSFNVGDAMYTMMMLPAANFDMVVKSGRRERGGRGEGRFGELSTVNGIFDLN